MKQIILFNERKKQDKTQHIHFLIYKNTICVCIYLYICDAYMFLV